MSTAEELRYAPYLKLQRANYHINDLASRGAAFLMDRPFKLIERHHRKAGKTTYRVKAEKPVPPEFSLIIGDAIHNMRAALDLTLFGMVGEIEPKIAFPFAESAKGLKAAIKERRIKVAGKKVVEAIRRLQPYPSGKGGALHTIHALDIQDKHRLLILTGQRALVTTGSGDEAFVMPLLRNFKPGVRIVFDSPQDENLLTVHREYSTRDLPDSEQETKVQPAFYITFGEGERLSPLAVLDVLTACAHETQAAVDTLVDAFLDPANT